jgi:hypothetical protein
MLNSDKNFTTKYDHTYTEVPYSSSKEIDIDITLKIPPEQEIILQAPYLYQLKMAWVQYFSILVPIFVIVYIFVFYLYKLNILQSFKVDI